MIERQVPKPSEIFELMRFRKPELDGTKRRLRNALTIDDLRDIARRRTPRAAFDYADGAAEGEISLARARQAFEDVEFHPSILRDVSKVDTSTVVFGGPSALPFGIAPTGFTRLMHTEGERAGAAAAGAAGIPFSLSTLGTTSIEDVRAANPSGRNWFQLYVMRDREISYELTRRAVAAGFDTLFFTVDAPVGGARLRDTRNGFSIPPELTLRTVLDAIPRPWWWYDFLTTPKLEFASLTSTGGTVGELLDSAMDPTISFGDLDVIRGMWPGKLVVKGVQNVEDAKVLAGLGVDGIVLSNHGGRQLDRAPVPFYLLPEVVKAVGNRTEVAVDTGIMNGADVVAAIALGARFTLVGRAYLYGLMAGGRAGVDRAIQILRDQVVRTMKLLQVPSVAELNPGHVTQLRRLGPANGMTPELRARRAGRRAFGGGDRAGARAHLAAGPCELAQAHPVVRHLGRRAGAAAFGDQHQLRGHDGQVMAGLVLVAATAQVHLRDRVQSPGPRRVQEHRQLDAVANRDRQRLHQLTAGRPLPRERLHDAGQMRPPQADEGPCHQLGDPSPVGGDAGSEGVSTIRSGEKPFVKALDQLYPGIGEEGAEEAGHEVGTPAGEVGVDEHDDAALGDQQRLPQCLALARVAAEFRCDLAGGVDDSPGGGRDLGGGVGGVGVHDDQFVNQAGIRPQFGDCGDDAGDGAFLVARRDDNADRLALAPLAFGQGVDGPVLPAACPPPEPVRGDLIRVVQPLAPLLRAGLRCPPRRPAY